VLRTERALTLDNAVTHEAFAKDAHVSTRQVKSLACLPFFAQGRLSGMVYLENNLSEGCFSLDRLAVLNLLLTQIAISLENATLYATLEDKVRERTEALERAQEHLLALEKAETERQMAGGFAHELRNALSGPKAALAQALGRVPDASSAEEPESLPHANARALEELYGLFAAQLPAEQADKAASLTRSIYENDQYLEELLEIVDKALSRGLTITHQIMDYAKTGQSRDAPVSIAINEVILDLKPELDRELANDGIVLRVDLDAQGPSVLCQETDIISIFRNIVQNARDALTESARSENDARMISVATRFDEGRAYLSVSDNGPGIPEEVKQRMFEPFFSTKPQTGTGLGLALVRKIVALRRGEIAVDTQAGKGTTFRISFPGAAAPAPSKLSA
jgi:histidine kinase